MACCVRLVWGERERERVVGHGMAALVDVHGGPVELHRVCITRTRCVLGEGRRAQASGSNVHRLRLLSSTLRYHRVFCCLDPFLASCRFYASLLSLPLCIGIFIYITLSVFAS